MGNFLQDVGRSTLSSSIKDMIQTKLSLDQGERSDVASANASALSAEQLIQAKRANAAAAEKETWENTPIPINAIKDSVEFGAEGPIFKHLYDKTKGLGYVDESNPANPTILRKHLINDVPKLMEQDILQINNMRIDAYNKQIGAANELLAKNPNDKKAQDAKVAATNGLMQATMHDAGLKELEKQKMVNAQHAATNATSIATNAATNAAHLQASQNSADATIKAAQLRLDHEKANDPTSKMPPDVKMAFDYIKKFTESTTPSPVMAMMAAGAGPDSPAAKALAQQQQQALDPEVQRRLAIANKKVEDYIAKGMGDTGKGTGLPEGLDESTIQYNMTQYGKSREEVIAKYKQVKGKK